MRTVPGRREAVRVGQLLVQDRIYASTLRPSLSHAVVVIARQAANVVTSARTLHYRASCCKVAAWGAGAKVGGRLRLHGPGRIVIGRDCVFEAGAANVIHAAARGATAGRPRRP